MGLSYSKLWLMLTFAVLSQPSYLFSFSLRSRVMKLRFQTQFFHLLALWPWVSLLTFLIFSLLMSMKGTDTLPRKAAVGMRWSAVKALSPHGGHANDMQVMAKDPGKCPLSSQQPLSALQTGCVITAHICHAYQCPKLFSESISMNLLPFFSYNIDLFSSSPTSMWTHTHTSVWGPPSICKDCGEEVWEVFPRIWDFGWTYSFLVVMFG